MPRPRKAAPRGLKWLSTKKLLQPKHSIYAKKEMDSMG